MQKKGQTCNERLSGRIKRNNNRIPYWMGLVARVFVLCWKRFGCAFVWVSASQQLSARVRLNCLCVHVERGVYLFGFTFKRILQNALLHTNLVLLPNKNILVMRPEHCSMNIVEQLSTDSNGLNIKYGFFRNKTRINWNISKNARPLILPNIWK